MIIIKIFFVDIVNNNHGSSFFAVTKAGKLYSWGENSEGQLCIGNKNNQHTPQMVNMEGKNVYKVFSYNKSTFILTTD